MTNLAKRPPLGLKFKEKKQDSKYLDYIRSLPCVVCQKFHEPQNSVTTAHHPIHDRFSTNKRSDYDAIPLCEGHHQGLWDLSKIAIHKEPQLWRLKYNADHEYSASIRNKYLSKL